MICKIVFVCLVVFVFVLAIVTGKEDVNEQ
jgi:hypothetical protein